MLPGPVLSVACVLFSKQNDKLGGQIENEEVLDNEALIQSITEGGDLIGKKNAQVPLG